MVHTKLGSIRGIARDHAGERVDAYLGVNYAEAPVGALRFRPPRLVRKPWRGELKAQSPAKTCIQTLDDSIPGFLGTEMWNPPTELSEDCLNMNIWVPKNPSGVVLVWIFGGGFFRGSPSISLYDGTVLAATTKAIVVNINYRVGPFGFLFLGHGSPASGNMGLLDQQAALQWINQHISSFGGDPSQVTLIGESAGAASATAHISAPRSYPYFSKVIANSGSIIHPWASRPAYEVLRKSMDLAAKLGCTTDGASADSIHECMTKFSAKEIQAKNNAIWSEMGSTTTLPFVPIRDDGNFFKEDLYESLYRGAVKKNVSVIIGVVKDEGTAWLPYYFKNIGLSSSENVKASGPEDLERLTDLAYKHAMGSFAPYFANSQEAVQIFIDAYKPVSAQKELKERIRNGVAQLVGDFFFTCSVKEYAEFLASNIEGSVYTYYFTRRSSANPWEEWMGVMHGYEIEYEFGLPFSNSSLYKESELAGEQAISRLMMEMIGHFAKTGTPSQYWPKYSYRNKQSLVIDLATAYDGPTLIKDFHRKYCDAIDNAKIATRRGYQQQ